MVFNAANSQPSNTHQYPTDKNVRKLFEVPTYESSVGVRIVLMWCKGQVTEFGAVVFGNRFRNENCALLGYYPA